MSEPGKIPDLNIKVARALSQKADELERQNKDKFRVIAHRRAAKVIRSEPRNLWGIYRSSGLKGLHKIKGVGHRIAWEIVSLVESKK